MKIIGRAYEKKQLERAYSSLEAQFIAVYGRRRVGKTYLIREFFNKKDCIFFRATGLHKAKLKVQLKQFKKEIENTFYKTSSSYLSDFTNWHAAFDALKNAIDILAGNKKKIIIFLDELPWMATPKSGLLEAIDYIWNRYWTEDNRIKLIICGSAASWMIDNVLRDTGGLYNRVTLRLHLEPFNLYETKEYLNYKSINYNHHQILSLYMCLGGIPFYLNYVEKGLSAIQNVNQICFQKKGTLFDEFNLLFASLFKNYRIHEEIIMLIASKREGISRKDLEIKLNIKGGRLTDRLNELEEAGFITGFIPWKKEKGIFYKIIDEYTLFYLTWIAPRSTSRIAKSIDDKYWEILSSKPTWKAWSGYSFEAICFKHVNQIKSALRIPDGSDVASWRYIPEDNNDSGAQIDLIFDRPDGIVNLCEIKYCNTPFKVDKKYAAHILNRERIYCKVTRTNKQIFHSMIVADGLKKTIYSEQIINSIVTLKDLFI